MLRRFAPSVLALWLIAAMSGCGVHKRVASSSPKSTTQTSGTNLAPGRIEKLPAAEQRLFTEAVGWLGTPYKYGGETKSGADCSGFVMKVFDNALGIKLPRNSAKQRDHCRDIDRRDLLPGDLVFFTVRGGSKVGHVGLYIGDDKMIHASTSRGVIITSLSEQYYRSNYFGSGRIDRYHAMLAKSAPASDKNKRDTNTPQAPAGIRSASPADAPALVTRMAMARRDSVAAEIIDMKSDSIFSNSLFE